MISSVITQLQKEVWAMEPRAMAAFIAKIFEVNTDSLDKLAAIEITKSKPTAVIKNGVATINIHGLLMKNPPSWLAFFGIETTDYNRLREQIAEAVDNKEVDSIVLHVDSPGGTVAGVSESAEAIAVANKTKTVSAYIEDLGASGAYYLASQAGTISANPNAEVGSIGVYTVYGDYSKMAEDEGVKIHVIRSGEHKGMGVIGAPITDEQIEAVQEVVNAMAGNFISAVSAGRKMQPDNVKKIATGRVWIAKDAKKIGLIDSVINGFENKNVTKPDLKGNNMAEQTEEQKQAAEAAIAEKAENESRKKMAEFQKAFPDDPQFAIEQFAAGVTLETAKANYAEVLKEKNKVLNAEKAELEEKSKKAKLEDPDPLINKGEGSGQESGFMETARQLAKDEKITKTEAMKRTKRENPELFEQYLQSCQPVQR